MNEIKNTKKDCQVVWTPVRLYTTLRRSFVYVARSLACVLTCSILLYCVPSPISGQPRPARFPAYEQNRSYRLGEKRTPPARVYHSRTFGSAQFKDVDLSPHPPALCATRPALGRAVPRLGLEERRGEERDRRRRLRGQRRVHRIDPGSRTRRSLSATGVMSATATESSNRPGHPLYPPSTAPPRLFPTRLCFSAVAAAGSGVGARGLRGRCLCDMHGRDVGWGFLAF